MRSSSNRGALAALLALLTACGGPSPRPLGSAANQQEAEAPADDAPRRNRTGAAPVVPVAAATIADPDPVPRVRIDIPPGAPSLGPEDAPVTLVLFSDLQCPFCARLEPTIDTLVQTYGPRLRVVWRDWPLPFHPHAEQAAEAAREALAQQGPTGFWRMQSILFANQGALERADLVRYAQQLGLDALRFVAALDSRQHLAAVAADRDAAARIEVGGTPTAFVNGRLVRGAQPLEIYVEIVNDELRRADALVARGVAPRDVYATQMRGARETARDLDGAGPPRGAAPSRRRPDPAAVYRVPLDGAPAEGRPDALVTIVVFSEFECPFCSRVLPTLERIQERYGRDVRLVFRHNPLPFHRHAMAAAEAAAEAYAQRGARGFWQMHDLLFANQRALERADLEQYARQIGLDRRRFARALDEGTHHEIIERDQALARQLGASGTPSFFINGRNLRGAQPFEAFEALIDEELARARARVEAGTARARVYEETIAGGATEPVLLDPADGE